jgi:predicted metal-binding membrane protein
MAEAISLEAVLKRDRAVVLGGIVGIAAVAWAYMAVEARAMYATGVCSCAGMQMSGPDVSAWSPGTLAPLFAMWAEMMVAMMLPSAAPMILTFAAVNRKRHEQERPFVPTGVFAGGYIAAWTAFSAAAALAQWILHAQALLSPLMVSASPWLGGALLIAAGIFQWTPWKHACLGHCRMPLGFLMAEWRDGIWGAFAMGFKHGVHCTGCCWVLMALLFVAGVMNLWWIAAISTLVLVEKLSSSGGKIGRLAGVGFFAWGCWLMTNAARL